MPRLTIRGRTIVLFGGTLLLLLGVLFAVLRGAVVNAFAELERDGVTTDLERVDREIRSLLDTMASTAADWGSWDATYEFAADRSPEYVAENLTDYAVSTLRLHLMVHLDPSGQVIHTKGLDPEELTDRPVAPGLLDQLSTDLRFRGTLTPGDVTAGLYPATNPPLLLVSHPILRSDKSGPPRGSLVLGRYLDEQLALGIGEKLQLRVAFTSVGATTGDGGTSIQIDLDGETRVVGLRPILDMAGAPAVEIRVTQDRTLFLRGLQVFHTTALTVLGATTGFLALLLLGIDRGVLHRIRRMGEAVRSLENGTDPNEIGVDSRDDEIGHLSAAVQGAFRAERERTAELRKSEERMQLALEGGDLGFWEWHIPSGKTYFSPRYLGMLGYEPEELPHTYDTWRDLLHPEDREEAERLLDSTLAGPTPRWRHEFRLREKDGGYRWIHARGKTVEVGPNGETLRFSGTHIDITRRRNAEIQRRHLEEHLRHGQKMEALGTLAGGIAHEFNNMLGGMMGFTELAQHRPGVPQEAKNDLDMVMEATIRARDLVQQILAFSRKKDVDREPLSANDLVRNSMQLVKASLPSAVTITEEVAPDVGDVLTSPVEFEQILLNLCTNAYQAVTPGTGRIEVALERVAHREHSVVSNLPAGAYARLTVRDNGAGMSEEVRLRVFEPFFTTKEVGRGTGMGLSVVHGVVNSHDGGIEVSSREGRGSKFAVYLPLATGTRQKAKGAPEERPPAQGNGEMILFVDDEELLTELARETLHSLGYESEVFNDPRAAIQSFEAHPQRYDLVITDLSMPGCTGEEVVTRVRAARPEVPVLLCTGFNELPEMDEGNGDGLQVLKKPLRRNELAAAVAGAVGRE